MQLFAESFQKRGKRNFLERNVFSLIIWGYHTTFLVRGWGGQIMTSHSGSKSKTCLTMEKLKDHHNGTPPPNHKELLLFQMNIVNRYSGSVFLTKRSLMSDLREGLSSTPSLPSSPASLTIQHHLLLQWVEEGLHAEAFKAPSAPSAGRSSSRMSGALRGLSARVILSSRCWLAV